MNLFLLRVYHFEFHYFYLFLYKVSRTDAMIPETSYLALEANILSM